MRVLVIGAGLVGQELARRLRAGGVVVVGTTTTPDKVPALAEVCDEVKVVRGSDTEAVTAAAAGCDAVVVCAGPNAQRAMSAEERAATYHDVLVATAESVVTAVKAAGVAGPVVALSSLSVYGDAADGLSEIDESAPVTDSPDASPRSFLAMERCYLEGLPAQACVFRCSDIYGASDPPLEAKVKMAHEYLKGSVPFSGDALFYRVHVLDVVAAIEHALENRLAGVYHLTHAEVPGSNRACFDAIGTRLGLGPLEFRNELVAPSVPVSTAKLAATGFVLQHTAVERA